MIGVSGAQHCTAHAVLVIASQLEVVRLDADEHVDDGVDAHWLGIGAVEGLFTNFTEAALDRVEAITDEVVGICIRIVAIQSALQSTLV